MEEIMKKQACMSSYSTPSPLSMHKDSQTISKAKPKIRIIHIFAPEIIKTDVANFRELVQRLTGKPTANDHQKGSCKKKPRIPRRDHQEPRDTITITAAAAIPPAAFTSSVFSSVHDKAGNNMMTNKKVDFCRSGFPGLAAEARERVKEEADDAEIWNNNGDNSCGGGGGGFLNGFADFDGFIQELGEFPLFPVDASSHHIHAFEETQLA